MFLLFVRSEPQVEARVWKRREDVKSIERPLRRHGVAGGRIEGCVFLTYTWKILETLVF